MAEFTKLFRKSNGEIPDFNFFVINQFHEIIKQIFIAVFLVPFQNREDLFQILSHGFSNFPVVVFAHPRYPWEKLRLEFRVVNLAADFGQ